ncbi:polysaccharide deacetylase family protein [Kordiimonas sediminis]|nr:polysaccharide deacetylase family protein [Kordiimonas sediminis]
MLFSYILVGVTVLAIVVFFWFLFPFLERKREEKSLADYCKEHCYLVLTFDDGPCELVTSPLLDLLSRRNVKASFFALGNKITRSKGLVRRLITEGHDLGSHSQNHLNAWKAFPGPVLKDIRTGIMSVKSIGGNESLFRPPYGKMTLLTYLLAKKNGLETCWWTNDPKDSLVNPKGHSDVLTQIQIDRGGILLLHDNDEYPNTDHTQYVLELVKSVIDLAEQENLQILTYSELLSHYKLRLQKLTN